ncbi:MAG: adenylate/guanylate cyclase domain-containing protein [Arenicellales bacterium]
MNDYTLFEPGSRPAAAGNRAADVPVGSESATRRGRLFRKYVILFVAVVCAALLANGLLQIWFAYRELTDSLIHLQHEQARAAADKIEQFVREIQAHIGWTTQLPWSVDAFEQRRFDAQRLLRQVPAITEVSLVDGTGRERLRVSRLALDVLNSGEDHSGDPRFTEAMAHKVFYGPVYFRRDSEPYMTIAVAGNRREAGVSVAEVNLKFIWDVVTEIRAGRHGTAYVVDGDGRLIAHPDISLVLRNTDLSSLTQVRAAIASPPPAGATPVNTAFNSQGRRVLTAYSTITPLGWRVFVELPVDEAYEPIYAATRRAGALLVGGLALAVLAGLFLARRMAVPIRILQQGALRIGNGELEQRIDIKTGDELEDLADQFNLMGGRLKQLYGNLERVSQLKRYFPPHLAELIVSSRDNILGESHRRDITVVFCDLRGFTAFSSSATPERVMQVLDGYYKCLGAELRRFGATTGHFAGDGLMAFFNDPLPCEHHQAHAARMALAMLRKIDDLLVRWRETGIDLGFGIGMASGDATLGHIGYEDQFHYTAIGPVVNLASRLCDQAASGQILIDDGVRAAIEGMAEIRPIPSRSLKGFPESIPIFALIELEDDSVA